MQSQLHKARMRQLLGVPFLLMASIAIAHADPLTLDQAVNLAEQSSFELKANAAQTEGTTFTAKASGYLPNPKIFAGIDNFPVTGNEAGQLYKDNMTMQKVGFMQDFPNRSKRVASTDVSLANADVVDAQQPILKQKIRLNTATAWLNLYYLNQKQALLQSLVKQNHNLEIAVQNQIANGIGQIADSVLPKQEAADLANQQDDLDREITKAKITLKRYVYPNAQMGDAVFDQLASAPELPLDITTLKSHVHLHPEVQMFNAELKLATAKIEEARAQTKPDWGLEVAYQHRAAQFGDMVSIQATYELPVYSSLKVTPLVKAAESEQLAVFAQRDAMLKDHAATLESNLTDYQALSRELERAKTISEPLAQQKADLLMSSYAARKADLVQVITARKEAIEQQMKTIELANKLAVTKAALYYSYGEGATPHQVEATQGDQP